jgi:hypothetical protein
MEQQVDNSGLQDTIEAYQSHITATESSCAATKARVSKANDLLQQMDLGGRILQAQVLVQRCCYEQQTKGCNVSDENVEWLEQAMACVSAPVLMCASSCHAQMQLGSGQVCCPDCFTLLADMEY